MGLTVEVKSWKQIVCKSMAEYYKEKTLDVATFVDTITRDLQLDIKDLADIKFAMDALGESNSKLLKICSTLMKFETVVVFLGVLAKVRERFVDDEALLTPIEECYAFLASQGYKVPEEESNRAESLRDNFNNIQARTLVVQDKICTLEREHRKKLEEAVAKFQVDLRKHLEKYRERGPMVEGLSPQDASDRLMMFQDEFDALHERYQLCRDGEKIFGFIPKEYPEMLKHQRELALLSKLYGLYNDVMRSIDGYSEIKWSELDIQKIMAELGEFQTRCRRLPKALKVQNTKSCFEDILNQTFTICS